MEEKTTYKTVDLFGNETFQFCEKIKKRQPTLFDDYEGFTKKFEVKKTTDDCYTPIEVYNAIIDFVSSKVDLTNKRIVRPFYPGGDYELIEYKDNDIIIDNPPFSIVSKIARYYLKNNVLFFLFAPHMTLFSSNLDCTAVVVGGDIEYENKAVVKTSFLTNIFKDLRVLAVSELYKKLKEIQKNNKVSLPKYDYPNNILTVSKVQKLVEIGINFEVKKQSCFHLSQMDAQKKHKKTLFGSGLLLSEKAAAEKAAAEKAAAEKDKRIIWELSPRELKLIETLRGE